MAEKEMDPLIARGIRLMLSKNEDATEQLRQLLEDEIRKRTGKSMGHLLRPETYDSGPIREEYRFEAEKKTPKADIITETSESNFQKRNVESKTATLHSEESPTEAQIPEDFDDDDDDSNSELNLEILEEDLTCVMCRGMAVGPRNRLIECSECHSLYHQECHQPPVAESEMLDPRSIWYCADCVKSMSRVPPKMRISPKLVSKEPPVIAKPPLKPDTLHSSALFRRTEKPTNTTPITRPASSAAVGMAGLAASLQPSQTVQKPTYTSAGGGKPSLLSSFMQGNKTFGGSSVTAKSSSAGSSPTTVPSSNSTSGLVTSASKTSSAASSSKTSSVVPKINVISANKRLANMKKKAAKMQEKRKHKNT